MKTEREYISISIVMFVHMLNKKNEYTIYLDAYVRHVLLQIIYTVSTSLSSSSMFPYLNQINEDKFPKKIYIVMRERKKTFILKFNTAIFAREEKSFFFFHFQN